MITRQEAEKALHTVQAFLRQELPRPLSEDLRPGMTLRFPENNTRTFTLDRRKVEGEDHAGGMFLPGWWLIGNGGFADFILDDPKREWEVVD